MNADSTLDVRDRESFTLDDLAHEQYTQRQAVGMAFSNVLMTEEQREAIYAALQRTVKFFRAPKKPITSSGRFYSTTFWCESDADYSQMGRSRG